MARVNWPKRPNPAVSKTATRGSTPRFPAWQIPRMRGESGFAERNSVRMSGWARSAWIRSNPLSFTGFGPYSGPLAGRGLRPLGVTDEGSRGSRRPDDGHWPSSPGALLARLLGKSFRSRRASSLRPSSLRAGTANPEPHANPTRAHPALALARHAPNRAPASLQASPVSAVVLALDESALRKVLAERSRLAGELGDVPEVRAERDGLERAIGQAIRERTAARDELVEREVQARGAWVRDAFGERPDGLRAGQVWDHGVRLAARYRVEHDVTDPGDALGPRPEQREEERGWERARKAIARDERQLGRDVEVELDIDLGIGF